MFLGLENMSKNARNRRRPPLKTSLQKSTTTIITMQLLNLFVIVNICKKFSHKRIPVYNRLIYSSLYFICHWSLSVCTSVCLHVCLSVCTSCDSCIRRYCEILQLQSSSPWGTSKQRQFQYRHCWRWQKSATCDITICYLILSHYFQLYSSRH